MRRVNGSQLHELTAALARASADPSTPAPDFWHDEEPGNAAEAAAADAPRSRRRRPPAPARPLPRAVAVLFVESWRDDHPHSLALRRLYESCLPAFFARDGVGFAVASHRELLYSPAARGVLADGVRPAASGAAAASEEERRRRLRQASAEVAARPLASIVRALPAIHVFGPGVGKGRGWRDRSGSAGGGGGGGGGGSSSNATAAAAARPQPPLLRRARYTGRHRLAPIVHWLAEATGEPPLMSPHEAARLYCGYEGGAAAAVRAGGRACPLADGKGGAAAAAGEASAWRCDFWDGEPTAAEMRRAWSSPAMWACAAIVFGRWAWWWWEEKRGPAAAAAAVSPPLRREEREEERGRPRDRHHAHAD